MTYHAMMFFWKLSEKHWLLTPFELIGNVLEDWGLSHGYITFSDKVMESIKRSREERL